MDIDFQRLRDEWALKSPLPSEDRMHLYRGADRRANPHNENYHNKPKIRSDAEIISDLSYQFADELLLQQYGNTYHAWRSEQRYVEDRGTWKQR